MNRDEYSGQLDLPLQKSCDLIKLGLFSGQTKGLWLQSSRRHGHVQNGEKFESFDVHITDEVE